MQDEHSFRAIPRPTLERLPKYLNYLRGKSAEGLLTTSSTAIAQDMHLSPIQVRKDLAFVTSGKPRVGHDTQQLIERLEHFLRCDSTHDAVLVGAGHLGKALLSYEGFGRYRLQILADHPRQARVPHAQAGQPHRATQRVHRHHHGAR